MPYREDPPVAHYVANISLFEHESEVRASIRVFRVYDYGAAPQRPVWTRRETLPAPSDYQPGDWLRNALQRVLEAL
jgi:hypothetical protein